MMPRWLPLLFFPAGMGLLWRLPQSPLLVTAALLLLVEQSRMAAVDMGNLQQLAARYDDPRLNRFRWVTLSTLTVELVGFYLALGQLGWGLALVLLSQLWFHLLAGIELAPQAAVAIQPRGIGQRRLVLAADAVGLALVLLWQQGIGKVSTAAALLAMVLAYGVVKYGPQIEKQIKKYGSEGEL